MSRPRIELDGPHPNRRHQRIVRRQLVGLTGIAAALIAGPFIASAIHLFTGG